MPQEHVGLQEKDSSDRPWHMACPHGSATDRPPHFRSTDRDPMPDATPQLRVLVVDDTVDNADALGVLLTVQGCHTAVAYSGAQGLAEAARFNPHLAFIDLEMPETGGCEVARHLRARHPKGTMRLICLTGRGQPDDRRTCMDAGFDEFFTKPMPEESLAKVLAASALSLGPDGLPPTR